MADFRLGRLKFNWRGAWAASTAYVIDDIVSFKGNTYVCVVNHTSAASETSWASTDLNIGTPRWQLHVPGVRIMGAWTPNTFYAVNDLVSYGSNQYLCVTNYTSSANQNLFYSSDLSNWSLYTSGTTYKGDWTSGTWYKLNDIVKYGNTLYTTTTAHTSGIQFDLTKYSVYLESVKFEDTWGSGTEYQPGDIVTFGGYTYIAKTINTNRQPNIHNVDIPQTPPLTGVIPADWNIVTTGFDMKGVYSNTTVYVPGDVVQFGGDTYVKIATSAAGIYPTDATKWKKVSSGLNWRGPWTSTATYQVNDVVSKSSASWVNLTAHNIDIDPVEDQTVSTEVKTWNVTTTTTIAGAANQSYSAVASTSNGSGTGATFNISRDGSGVVTTITAVNKGTGYAVGNTVTIAGANIGGSTPADNLVLTLTAIGTGTGGANWQALAQGESTLTLQNPGDTLYRNAAGANVPLPIGTNGQVLTVNNGLPAWERNNLCANVFYVATDGTDATTHGKNISRPWKTLRYALSQIPTGTADNINTIFVKSGTYPEQLPLTVPAYTSIVGDNLRATVISPKSTGLSTDATPVENRFSTMFFLSESTTLKDMIFSGMEGFQPATGLDSPDITQSTIRGVFLRLNPSIPITGKSPYITQCSAFSGRPLGEAPNCTGGVGAIIDKGIYGNTVSNGSMLFDSFTQFHDLGVGFWCKDLGNAEIVSSFTYYCHIGYTCSGGGRIRSLVGNNSWGTYGAVSSGFDTTETPITGTVRGQRLNFSYDENSALFKQNEQVAQSTVGSADYALALILYVQSNYLVIEPITGTFANSKPIAGVGSANVVASGATATTAAGGATPALEGVKGKIFPLTNLPVLGGNPVLPKITGATKFLNVSGASQYNDSGYYVIKDVVDAGVATNIFISNLRRYDVPGTAPSSVNVSEVSRVTNVTTLTTSGPHGLSTGDKVVIAIPSATATVRPFATGFDATDGVTKGIIGGVLQRTTVTVLTGNTFSYPNQGTNLTISSGDSRLQDAKVYKQGTTGGSTLALHAGGASVTLYNVSSITGMLNAIGTVGIDNSATEIPFSDDTETILTGFAAGANNFVLVNNELMRITAVNSASVTVVRAQEGTTAAAHTDGSIIYYVTKTANATSLRGDVDTAVTDIPLFSIANFDTNDIVKVDDEFFRITSVNQPQVGRATIIFAGPKNVNANNGQSVEIRLRYSQVRMTGHDFLQVGTGNKANTNWPGTPITSPVQANEIVENFPGRCYYVSSDQDGNFRVGEFFVVEQATGTATLDASAFNLSGLSSLRLGTLGAELGVSINEFSADATLGGDFARDAAVSTQLAVKTYVDGQVGAGIIRTAPTIGVSQITSSGTTATVTSYVANNVYQGDQIVVSGANQANYNGTFTVTAVNAAAKTFAYTMSGNAISPATGTITVERKQKIATDLDVAGTLKVRPTWNTASSTEALTINATNTQSGAGTTLIDAQVGNVSKFKVDKDGNATFAGNITVSGTTTTVNSTNLSILDKEIIIGNGATNAEEANGAGLQVGTSDLSFKYDNASTRWNLPNAGLNVGGAIKINGTNVITDTTLGSGIVNSSLTSLGALTGLNVNGVSKLYSVTENLEIRSASQSGTQTYDFAQRAIYYHPSIGGAITVALSNVPTDASKVHTVTMVVVQGSTAYNFATSFGVNGFSANCLWADGTQPTGDASKTNVWTFTIINTSSTTTPTWVVIGSKRTFG